MLEEPVSFSLMQYTSQPFSVLQSNSHSALEMMKSVATKLASGATVDLPDRITKLLSRLASARPIDFTTTDSLEEIAKLALVDASLRLLINSEFRKTMRSSAIGRWVMTAYEDRVAESWIIISLARDAKVDRGLDTLLRVEEAKLAVDRFLEMIFYEGDVEARLSNATFFESLQSTRPLVIQALEASDGDPVVSSLMMARIAEANETLSTIEEVFDPHHTDLFNNIESCISEGVIGGPWLLNDTWKLKIKAAVELFYSELAKAISAKLCDQTWALPFTNFVENHHYPHRLLRLLSPIELSANASSSPRNWLDSSSEGEYVKYLIQIADYCSAGGHIRTVNSSSGRHLRGSLAEGAASTKERESIKISSKFYDSAKKCLVSNPTVSSEFGHISESSID
jgi:hypothetical protein